MWKSRKIFSTSGCQRDGKYSDFLAFHIPNWAPSELESRDWISPFATQNRTADIEKRNHALWDYRFRLASSGSVELGNLPADLGPEFYFKSATGFNGPIALR